MKRHFAFLGLLSCCAGRLAAQETSGDIRGRLRTGTAAVVDAQITATSADLLGSRYSISASDGVFLLLALPPGTYTLNIRALGYRPVIMQQVPVRLGRTTSVPDVYLEAITVMLDPVIIAAPRVSLDPVRTTIGGTLEAKDYAELPGDRDYTAMITIFPHINTSYHGDPANSGGSTGLENMYYIDGVNVTTPLKANGGTRLPYNFVRSVEVRAGGYEAQYGRALGAIVNAVTYTGTNDFESNGFGFFTHSGLSATPRAAPVVRETASYSYDIGARVSGPMVRDRLWFSAAYNPRVSHVGIEISGLGTYPDDSRADNFAGKLTWQASRNSRLEFSVFGDPSVHNQVAPPALEASSTVPLNPDPFLTRLENGGVTTSLRATANLGTSLQVEASIGRSASRDNNVAQTERGNTEVAFLDHVANTISGGVQNQSSAEQTRSSFALRGTLTARRHSLVLGIEHEDEQVTFSVTAASVSRFATDSFSLDSSGFTRGTVHNRLPTLFLQDSWRVANRFTLNAGVRWSQQQFIGIGGATGQRLPNEWQPRIGFSWQLDDDGEQRILGSYGRFYQQEPLYLAASFYLDYFNRRRFYATDPRLPGAIPDTVQDYSTPGGLFTYSKPDITAERFDEVTLGYERLFAVTSKLTIRAIRRELGTTYQWGVDPTFRDWLGTPGKGDLAFLPPARRAYTALEVDVEGVARRLAYRASYVLSRTWGNFTGLYGSDVYLGSPGYNYGLQRTHQIANSTGLLPNDRTHVVKLSATYPLSQSLTSGLILAAMSGTPINDFGAFAQGTWLPAFLQPRGSLGRTPTILDAGVRLTWRSPWPSGGRMKGVLDVQHIGNFRSTVRIDQFHYLGVDALGNQDLAQANPNFLKPVAYQPPMSLRLGIDINF